MKALLCKLILSCAVAGPNAKPVDDLAYGTVLYEYFQHDYQAAMVNTLVAEAQGQTGDNSIRFDLAKGSFAFSDHMYRYANEIFAQVDPAELTELDNLRLAFHLARDHHRRGNWAALEQELAKIELGKSWLGKVKMHPEVEFMRSELLVQKQQFALAQTTLEQLDEHEPLRAYGLYNLGVALRTSSPDAARDVFTQLSNMPAYSKEAFDLIQRAKLARAFLAREQSQRADAQAVLEELPGTGRYRDTALAAYASLAMDNGDHELAARIWMTLQEESYWTPSTAAARLGFPLSLEKLASSELALEQYRVAERSFSARLTALDSLTVKAQDPQWVRGLLSTFAKPQASQLAKTDSTVRTDQEANPPAQKKSWWRLGGKVQTEVSAPQSAEEIAMGEVMQDWQQELGHTDWLEWLSSEAVHDVLMQWSHLQGEREWLGVLPNTLEAFAEVAQERKRRASLANETLYTDGLVASRDSLIQVEEGLKAQILAVKNQKPSLDTRWLLSLATPEERKRLLKLEAMANKLERYIASPQSAASKTRDWQPWLSRIERLRGLIFWEIAHSSTSRVRALEKSLAEVHEAQRELDQRVARVQGAQAQFVASTETNFVQLNQRAEAMHAQVDQAIEQREQILAQEIRKGMHQEQRQVKQYLLATRIAIARASDQLADVDPSLLPKQEKP